MTLAEFLDVQRRAGRTRYRVVSPRGYDLCKGEMVEDVTDKMLRSVCEDDAQELVRGREHEYTCHVENGDGMAMARHAIRVRGGKDDAADGVPDASQLMTKPTLDGNVTRFGLAAMKLAESIIDKQAQTIREQAKTIENQTSQLLRTEREAMRKGKWTVEEKRVDYDHEEKKLDRERSDRLLGELVDLGRAVLGGRLLGPGGKDAVWAKFKEELTEEQLLHIARAIGVPRMTRLLALASADKACAFFLDSVTQEEAAALSSVLSEGQQAILGQVCAEELKRRAESANGKSAAAGGAPS